MPSLVLGLRRPACSRAVERRRVRAGAARLFVNLTNGVEALPALDAVGLPYTFCRLQSSLCEAQAFEQLCVSVDTHLLMSLACGHSCYVVDFASRNKKRGVPRAVWYGTEFISYALDTLWMPADAQRRAPILRGFNVTADFQRAMCSLSKPTLQRLKYYRRYVDADALAAAGGVRLFGVCGPTERDSDVAFHAALVRTHATAGWSGDESGRAELARAELGAERAAALATLGLELWTGNPGHADWQAARLEGQIEAEPVV